MRGDFRRWRVGQIGDGAVGLDRVEVPIALQVGFDARVGDLAVVVVGDFEGRPLIVPNPDFGELAVEEFGVDGVRSETRAARRQVQGLSLRGAARLTVDVDLGQVVGAVVNSGDMVPLAYRQRIGGDGVVCVSIQAPKGPDGDQPRAVDIKVGAFCVGIGTD